MLPAADLSEILTNLAALNLQPNTAAAVLGAVLAPLLRARIAIRIWRSASRAPPRGQRGASGRNPRLRPRTDPNGR